MGVTIVIPNYNGEKYLEKCIDSIYIQTLIPEEIIIVDNASTDNSINIINKKISEYSQKLSIKLTILSENKGFSVAVNEGIKLNKSEFVILLNNDTELHKDFTQNLYNAISMDDKIFACCSKMLRYDNRNIIDDAGDGYTLFGFGIKHGDGKQKHLYDKKCEVFSACAGAAIYKSSVFNEIGLFDENFFAYLEDMDICYRARIYGYKNHFEPSAIVYHIGSATSGSRHNDFKVRLSARNNIFLLYKNMPFMQLAVNFIFILAGIIIKQIYFLFKGLGKSYFSGIMEGLKTKKKITKITIDKNIKNNLHNYINIEKYLIKDTITLLKRG